MFVYTRLKLNVDRLLSLVNKNIILACKYNQSHNNKNATSNTFPLIYAPSGLMPEWSCVLPMGGGLLFGKQRNSLPHIRTGFGNNCTCTN